VRGKGALERLVIATNQMFTTELLAQHVKENAASKVRLKDAPAVKAKEPLERSVAANTGTSTRGKTAKPAQARATTSEHLAHKQSLAIQQPDLSQVPAVLL
jgi:hypothetical protein